MRWTEAQLATIETRDKNILVSAAAGSGKTTVLIERIKRLVLEEGVDIDRFLITTFTRAAAAEMKEKMQKSIREEMEELKRGGGPKEERVRAGRLAYLQRQLDLLPQSSISTFHTFSIGIMRDYFYLTDLSPGFVVGDETRLSIMRKEVIDHVFEGRFERDGEAFRSFLRRYSGDRNDERLKDQILDVYQQMRSIPRYMQWAEDGLVRMRMESPVKSLGLDLFLAEEAAEALAEAIRWYQAAEDLLNSEETGSLYLKARADREAVLAMQRLAEEAVEEAEKDPSQVDLEEKLQEIGGAVRGFSPNRMTASKDEKDAYETVKDEMKWLRKKGKEVIDHLGKKYFTQTMEECDRILRAGADDTEYFIGLIAEFDQTYTSRKQDQNMVDFDDCMHYAIGILEDEQAAAETRDRFKYIFIDEYQDSNLLQEEIVSRIARGDNLFMVGDVKQSIYKFRLAEPEIFRRRYLEYRSGKDKDSIRIDLNSNFRSRKTIRDAVNRIFGKIMDGYDDDAGLKGPEEEKTKGYPVRLHILDKAGQEEEPESGETTEELTEAGVIADIIRDCLGRPITGRDGVSRPVTYGDIAVLSRGAGAISGIERYLNGEGIPAFGETAGGYYETVEIQVFLNLLKLISNLDQDVPLISAMSSVVFDFSPEELARIRIEFRGGSYVQAVRAYALEGSDEGIKRKISLMLDQILLWKEIARTVPLDELMRSVLYETGYYDYCSGLPVGRQRTSNLRLLLEKAAMFEQTSHMGLYGFLSYVEAMKRTGQKVSEASLIGEGRGVVHVMTVHKSKGLEFPVVILAGAGKKIRASSEGRAPAMHKDLSIGLAEVDLGMRWERKTLLQKAIAGKKTRESLEEEIRILYVALTRPMDRLEIVGSVNDAGRLQRFAGRGSFMEMIYGTLRDMAEEDPSAAEVVIHRGRLEALAGDPVREESAGSEQTGKPAQTDGVSDPGKEGESTEDRDSREERDHLPDYAEIDRRLSFRYAFENDRMVRQKYSVTELAGIGSGEEDDPARRIPRLQELPAGGEKKPGTGPGEDVPGPLSAAQIGSAMHAVMERIDFSAAFSEGMPYIEDKVRQLHDSGILTDQEFAAVRTENIDAFFRSETGERAAKADLLQREKEFLLQKEIDGVPAIVQGVIDCYFEDGDGLVLVDYKNSRAAGEGDEAALIDRYAGQIRLYSEALRLALGRPVDEAWLYLFRTGRFLRIELDEKDGEKQL